MVGAAFTILAVSVDRERSAERLAQHSNRVLATAERLGRQVHTLQSSQRDFLATGDRRFLRSWNTARRAAPRTAEQLSTVTRVPEHIARARRIAAGLDTYLAQDAVPLVGVGRRDLRAARRLGAASEIAKREDALWAQLRSFTTAERRFAAQRTAHSRNEARVAGGAAIAGLAGSVLLIVAFGAYLTRAIVVPVRRAAAMAGRMAADDLSVRLPETGPGEIGALQRTFNMMGESLQSDRENLRQLADEQSALRRVATLIARGVPATELLAAVVQEVDRVLGSTSTRLAQYLPGNIVEIIVSSRDDTAVAVGGRWAADGDHLAGVVHETGRAARRDSLDGVEGELAERLRRDGVRSGVAAPIVVEGRLWGIMLAYWTDRVAPPDTGERLEQFTELVATAIANAEGRAALTASRSRVVATADETRRRIERDLHDGAQQRLVHAIVTLKLARRALEEGSERSAAMVDEALEHAERANGALRELVHGILPASLSRGGLRPALKGLVERAPIVVRVTATGRRFAPALEATAYFIAAEALTNVYKHSGADSAQVTAEVHDGVLRVEVHDDGAGGATVDGGSGLLGLHDRAAAAGGHLDVVSPPGAGTTVTATLPLEPDESPAPSGALSEEVARDARSPSDDGERAGWV